MSAPAELVIEVTAEDIALGDRGNVCLCPVARAACRLLGVPVPSDEQPVGSVTAYGGGLDIWRASDCDWDNYLIPQEAVHFIHAFDSGEEVTPFTFTARLDGES